MKQIAPGLHSFSGLLVGRVYLIEDPDGLTIIDASLESAAKKIVTQLQAAGRKPQDVRRILITHAHPDHVGGLPELQRLTGARVIASGRERPVIEGKEAIARPDADQLTGIARRMRPSETFVKPTPVDQEIAEGDVLTEVMGGLHVLATPGHAPGHVTFWQPERRIMFCGDVIMHLLGLRLPIAAFTVDMQENRRSIARLAALDAAIVCFGHGQPLTSQSAQQIRDFAKKVGATH